MDYAHARHAGNAGDVWKHAALVAALGELTRAEEPLQYLETHAGDGLYPLGSLGEWGDGVKRVFSAREGLVGRYAELVRAFSPPSAARPLAYPGSPLIAARMLRERDRATLYEIDPRSAGVLRKTVPAAEVRESDGLLAETGGRREAARAPSTPSSHAGDGLAPSALDLPARTLVLIDPPFTQKQEWTDAARTAARLAESAAVLFWYPIKALTRPRALLAELSKLGMRGVAAELHWTPLRLKRERLNGAGMIFAGAARAALPAFMAAVPELGAALQTHGEWTSVQIGF